MTGQITALAGDYIELCRGLGYRSPSQERAAGLRRAPRCGRASALIRKGVPGH